MTVSMISHAPSLMAAPRPVSALHMATLLCLVAIKVSAKTEPGPCDAWYADHKAVTIEFELTRQESMERGESYRQGMMRLGALEEKLCPRSPFGGRDPACVDGLRIDKKYVELEVVVAARKEAYLYSIKEHEAIASWFNGLDAPEGCKPLKLAYFGAEGQFRRSR